MLALLRQIVLISWLSITLLLLISCAEKQTPEYQSTTPPAPPQTITVMTFNIRYANIADGINSWAKRRDWVVAIMQQNNADFIGVQEALQHQTRHINKALATYKQIGDARNADRTTGEASPLYYNTTRWKLDETVYGTFWLSNTPTVAGSKTKSWGNDLPRICTWGRFIDKKTGAIALVFNTHYSHMSQKARENSSTLILKKVTEVVANENSSRTPLVIVMGDLNARHTNTSITTFTQRKPNQTVLVDVWAKANPTQSEPATFNGWGRVQNTRRIDYIFTLPNTPVIKAKVITDHQGKRYPSDHYPVVAELRWPGGGISTF